MFIKKIGCVGILLLFIACSTEPLITVNSPSTLQLVSEAATKETKALYSNLSKMSDEQLLFGHQNTTAYGVKWYAEPERSDIKDVTGSFPAIFGWDLGHLGQGDNKNLDGISFDFIKKQVIAAYDRGAISTFSWHMRDPVTGGSSWDKAPSVKALIPGGSDHDKLKTYLDAFVEFNRSLISTTSNIQVPVIFRPWHEHNGDWFWWGKGENLTSEQDYISLWRFTIDYLRNEKGVTNLIYAFSPDRSRMDINHLPDSYFYGYPGDNYVDIIGLDNYWDLGHPSNNDALSLRKNNFIRSLEAIGKIAKEKNKVAALTEGGMEKIAQADFWTEMILDSMLTNENTKRISYALFWRNANKERENKDHYYAPYTGHSSAKDFVSFFQHPYTVFENDLLNIYK